MMRFVYAVIAALLGFTLLSAPAVSADTTVTRGEMLQRAAVWLTANNGKQVPYDQGKNWKDGYRQDCSGYVSMAAKLRAPGPNTVALFDSQTVPINKADMKPGDLFIDKIGDGNNRHVVIFEKWANDQRSAYVAFEQRGGHGTDHRERAYGLSGNDQYQARRLKGIRD